MSRISSVKIDDKFVDLTGQRFGRLTVLRRVEDHKGTRPRIRYLCFCDCGNEIVVMGQSLKSGHTQSCGCLQKETIRKISTKHGHSKKGRTTSTYNSWDNMIQRCYNPKNLQYKDYGGRDIRVCEGWHKFENFLEDMGECPKGLTIERINNDGHYCLENCKWDTKKNQTRNKRTNIWLEYKGIKMVQKDWAILLGVKDSSIGYYLKKGKSFEWVVEHFMKREGITWEELQALI